MFSECNYFRMSWTLFLLWSNSTHRPWQDFYITWELHNIYSYLAAEDGVHLYVEHAHETGLPGLGLDYTQWSDTEVVSDLYRSCSCFNLLLFNETKGSSGWMLILVILHDRSSSQWSEFPCTKQGVLPVLGQGRPIYRVASSRICQQLNSQNFGEIARYSYVIQIEYNTFPFVAFCFM